MEYLDQKGGVAAIEEERKTDAYLCMNKNHAENVFISKQPFIGAAL
jgi:hypothetical protein